MSRFKLYFLVFSIYLHFSDSQISDKRLCMDDDCSSPISQAKTLMRYFSPDGYRLSFKPNEEVVIYSKSAGSNEELWGAEIRGKRGYIPKTYVREIRIFGTPTKLVATEISNDSNLSQVPMKPETVSPSKVKQSFEVIDGTTLYIQPDDNVRGKEQVEIEKSNEETLNNIQEDSQAAKIVDHNIGNDNLNKAEGKSDNQKFAKVIKEDASNDASRDQEIIKNSSVNESVQSNVDDTGYLAGILDAVGIVLGATDGKENGEHESTETKEKETEELKAAHLKTEPLELISDELVKQNLEGTENILKSTDENILIENLQDQQADKTEENAEDLKGHETKEKLEDILKESGETVKSNDSNEKERDLFEDAHSNSSNIEQLTTEEVPENSTEINEKLDEIPEIGDSKDETVFLNSTETEAADKKIIPDISSNIQEKSTEIKQETPEVSSGIEDDSNKKSEHVVTESVQNKAALNELNLANQQEKVVNSDNLNDIDPNLKSNEVPSETDFDVEKDPRILNNFYNNYVTEYQNLNSVTDQPPSVENISNPTSNERIEENPDLEYQDNVSEKNESSEEKETEERLDHNILQEEPSVGNNLKDNAKREPPTEKPDLFFNLGRTVKDVTQNLENIENVEVVKRPSQNEDNEYPKKEENVNIEYTNPNNFEQTNEEVQIGNPLDVQPLDSGEKDEVQNSEKLEKIVDNVGERQHEIPDDAFCTNEECPSHTKVTSILDFSIPMGLLNLNTDFFLYLATTAISVIIFLLGYLAIDKSRREGPLVAKINKLEKEFLVVLKEKEILAEEIESSVQQSEYVESQEFFSLQKKCEEILKQKEALEEQVQTLEKELENSTELGLELNKMLSDILNSDNAGATLMLNIEGLQAQLAEQQDIVSNMKEMVSLKETENHELNLELDISNKKVVELQSELDKMLLNIIKLEEEKEAQERNAESQMMQLKNNIDLLNKKLENNRQEYTKKTDELNNELSTSQRNLQLKAKEYNGLKDSMQQIKTMKNANTLESLLEVTSIKAEFELLKSECQSHCETLKREKETNSILEKRAKSSEDEVVISRKRLDEVDKARLELATKLEVLTNYFKEKETQLQKDLSKYESMWSTKQGEATSTSERIKYLQSEVQNYKGQNESLKQEIISQEVELKSQISVLEKKVHENWVSARQAERKLEDLKHEASQLRNRLTLRERAIQEDKTHNRVQSPLEHNGDLPISPLHLESPSSPPLLYSSRDHLTTSPAMLGMPPPFLPPPPGTFLPPPHLPFLPPPPPDLFPVDHRPPPLGRMSSPPLNSRYSPDRRSYSPYDRRRSPSPSYDESEYGASPVHHRRYSPFSRRMDHRRMPHPSGKINGRSGELSSGSGDSNDSLDEINHSNLKV